MKYDLRTLAATAAGLALTSSFAAAAPFLSLRSAGGTATSATIAPGTATFSIDVALDSDGRPVGGVQFHLSSNATGSTLKYGAAPMATLGNPFVANDVAAAPAAQSTVDAGQVSALFKGGAGDYPATAGAQPFARMSFDTSQLAARTYTITPTFELFTNGSSVLEQPGDFGPSGTFALTVGAAPVPEPATLAATLGVAAAALVRRRRSGR